MSDALSLVLLVVLIALAGSVTYAVWVAVATMRSTRELVGHLDESLPALIEQASATLDTVDREMGRVDGIVSRFEDVSDTVSATTRAATEAVRVPLVKLAGVSGGVKALFGAMRRR